MQIVIDMNTVWLDDEANEFLNTLKSTMTEDDLEDWLNNWLTSVITPALMRNEEVTNTLQ